ncbi:flavodoxin [Limosilactobacillus fermentum]|uniref:flavodoxin n=1 Tax=Limosilactobacillus fermentum TaxID=1613 RepID=UPI0033141151
MEKKILIATYSWSGHTKRLADQIAKLLPGADQYQIAVPAGTYDLTDMYATSDRAKNQLATGELPPLANPIPELDQYNLILVGSPVPVTWPPFIPMPGSLTRFPKMPVPLLG